LFPVDVFQAKARNVAGTKSHACKQQQNGAISAANGCGKIARLNDTFNISRLQILRQSRKAPMRHGWDASVQTGRTLSFGNQETEKHPDARYAGFLCSRS
jgi:hypothetical protein